MPRKNIDCVARLQAAADALADEGAPPAVIVASLASVAVKSAEKDWKVAAGYLDSAAVLLSAAAEIARSRHVSDHVDQIVGAGKTKNAGGEPR